MPSIPKIKSPPKPSKPAEGILPGIAGGLFRDPIVQLGLSQFYSEAEIAEMQSAGGEGWGGQLGRTIGEFGMLLAPGFGAIKAGQKAGGLALKATAKRAGTVGKVPLKNLKFGYAEQDTFKKVQMAEAMRANREATVLARQREKLGVSDFLQEMGRKIPPGMKPNRAREKGLITKAEYKKLDDIGYT